MLEYFVVMYENRTIKLVEIVLRSGEGIMRVSLKIKIYFKHICKCHNLYSLYNNYMLVKKEKEINCSIIQI
jgi:hypothetical protein